MPSRNGMDIEFSELTDLSGRKAEVASHKGCQLIAVDILPGPYADGVSNPVLAPDLPDLGCDPDNYPPVAIRLNESGSPVLSVRVAADGSVTDAQLITSGGKARLDAGALQLARQKLKFVPAMRNGRPIEVVHQVQVFFKVLQPIRTIVDGVAVTRLCSDDGLHPNGCYEGYATITLVPAKNRAKLKVTSGDIKGGTLIATGNISPALKWTAGPSGTRSYVLVSEERITAPDEEPRLSWIVLDIPPFATSLPQGIPTDLRVVTPAGAVNAFAIDPLVRVGRRPGYQRAVSFGGHDLPVRLQIFALDTKLHLDPMAVSRDALINAMKGHVLASGEIATADANKNVRNQIGK
jgi:TonB family protein